MYLVKSEGCLYNYLVILRAKNQKNLILDLSLILLTRYKTIIRHSYTKKTTQKHRTIYVTNDKTLWIKPWMPTIHIRKVIILHISYRSTQTSYLAFYWRYQMGVGQIYASDPVAVAYVAELGLHRTTCHLDLSMIVQWQIFSHVG